MLKIVLSDCVSWPVKESKKKHESHKTKFRKGYPYQPEQVDMKVEMHILNSLALGKLE